MAKTDNAEPSAENEWRCAVCSEPIKATPVGFGWTHVHGEVTCGTGDGSTAYPPDDVLEAARAAWPFLLEQPGGYYCLHDPECGDVCPAPEPRNRPDELHG